MSWDDDRVYVSVNEYLSILAHPHTYAGHIEMAAANSLHHIHILYEILGSAMPGVPPVLDIANNNHLYVLFYPSTRHYVSMSPVYTASN